MQRERHLASGDLCRKGAPLGQGALVQIAGAGKRPVLYSRLQAWSTAFHTAGSSPPWTPRRPSTNCPLRMRCINSIPAIVIAAVAKPLKPSIVAIRCFAPRWSCSIRLFKYFEDRSFVSARQQAVSFQLTHRTVGRGIAVQSDRPGSIVLAFDRLPKKRLGGRDIALGAQPEVNRPPRAIHGTIEIAPFASNFDVCLVYPI
jgi:hypothetical protein